MSAVPVLSADEQYAVATVGGCADALAAHLRAAGSVGADPARTTLDLPGGQLIVMPSTITGSPSVKVLTVDDAAATNGTPRIQGVHVQFDRTTLAPVAILDAVPLTLLRTTAVSVLALRSLAHPESRDLVVFGTGPQAGSHVLGIAAEWPVERVRLVGRSPARGAALVRLLSSQLPEVAIVAIDAADVDGAVREADIVVCATTSPTPVFLATPHDGAAVVAIGSHEAHARELPSSLLGGAFVGVEDRATALSEAGDLVLAIQDGAMTASDVDADLVELVMGTARPGEGPRVFKSVGMAWEDAVVADAILRARPTDAT